jgi:hypothetical protein
VTGLEVRVTFSDEQLLDNLLVDLRSDARMELHFAEKNPNPDTRAILVGAAEDKLKQARALHRFMQAHGVKGLGPINY